MGHRATLVRIPALLSTALIIAAILLPACAQQPAATPAPQKPAAAPTSPAQPAAAPTSAQPATAATKPAAGPPIVIGKVESLTGSLAFEGTRERDGDLLAVKVASEQGGALGRPIVLRIADVKSDPAASVSAMEDLIAREKPVAMLGPYGSPFGVPLGTAMAKYGLPMIFGWSAFDPADKIANKYDWAFNAAPLQPYYYQAMVNLVKMAQQTSDPPKTIALPYVQGAFGEGLANMIKNGFSGLPGIEQATGLKIVATEPYEPTVTDLRPLLLRLKALSPDVIFATSNTPDTILLVKQLREVGVPTKMLFFPFTPLYADVQKGLGAGLDGVTTIELAGFGAEWPASTQDPKLLPSYNDLAKLVFDTYGTNLDTPIYIGYDQAALMITAIRNAGSTDKAAISAALAKLKTNTPAGPLDFTVTGIAGEIRQGYHHMVGFQYQNGKPVPLTPDAVAKGKLVYPATFK